MRSFLVLTWLVCALPFSAHAQWATSRVEHDWRVHIGGSSFGIAQEFVSTISTTVGTRTTIIYIGPITFRTRLPAVWVVGVVLVPVATVSFFLVAKACRAR